MYRRLTYEWYDGRKWPFTISRLEFEIISRFPSLRTDLPDQEEHMEAIKSAEAELNSPVAKRHVQEALTKTIAPAADRTYKKDRKFWSLWKRENYELEPLKWYTQREEWS